MSIQNESGPSSYFQGRFREYGLYQWNIKYYGFMDENESNAAVEWAFGFYDFKNNQFEILNDLLGRPVKAWIDGRSGGWLVIDTELSELELELVSMYVKDCRSNLPQYLNELRSINKESEHE